MSDLQKSLWKLGFVLALIPVGIYFWAQAYYSLWTWFAVPLGAPVVSMAHAYGLSCLARAYTWNSSNLDTKTEGAISRAFTATIVAPWLIILTGHIVVHWIGI
jgi:hypothetical protein